MNMPSESFEPVRPNQTAAMTGSRRNPSKAAAHGDAVAPGDVLLPHVVDAAFADEMTPAPPQRGSRRDLIASAGTTDSAMHKVDVPHVKKPTEFVSDAQATRMLRSLGQQTDALREQQDQIRRLIEQVEMFSTGAAAR